jgi:hypothetical protein
MHTMRIAGQDTGSNPSGTIWGKFPVRDVQEGVAPGYFRHYDFANFRKAANVNASVAYWADGVNLYGSDGAVIADAGAQGGGSTFSSDGDNEGVAFQLAGLPMFISRDYGRFCLEVRLKTSTIADTKHGFFVGLLDTATLSATVPIAAAGTLADENFLGFHRLEGDGDAIDTVYKADGVTQVTVAADAVVLVADTYVKLGMIYEPYGDKDGSYVVSFYKDGVRLAASKQVPTAAGTDFPNDVVMAPVFALLNATATTPGSTTIDWMRVGQLPTPGVIT